MMEMNWKEMGGEQGTPRLERGFFEKEREREKFAPSSKNSFSLTKFYS